MAQCQFCGKECQISDSRLHPSSTDPSKKERIHNRCLIKKSLANRHPQSSTKNHLQINQIKRHPVLIDVEKKAIEEQKCSNERKFNEISEKQNQKFSNFRFDIEAGIARDKKRYLHHRKLSEMTARYDDQGFQSEEPGRAYDHTGRDLQVLGTSSEDESDNDTRKKRRIEQVKKEHRVSDSFQPEEKSSVTPSLANIYSSAAVISNERPCWFCLGSPSVDKRLIIAIGEHCYLALSKGGLVEDHLLILPISHISSLNDPENSKDLLRELRDFQESLIKYFKTEGKGVIFFERNFRSVHWQLQVVPINLNKNNIEEKIKLKSRGVYKNSNYTTIPPRCSIGDIIPTNVPYFYWRLSPQEIQLVMRLPAKGPFFPVQFGREVLADKTLLDVPERIDWKSCVLDNYEDIVSKIKYGYSKFDIT